MLSEFTLPSATAARLKVLSFGIYMVTHEETQAAPRTAAGLFKTQSDFALVRQTDIIHAAPGLVFGLSFVVSGGRPGEDVSMDWITRFPRSGLVNAAGERFERDAVSCDVPFGAVMFRSYSLDEPWEMVPGEWIFEFWSNGWLIGEQRFTVMARPRFTVTVP